MEKRTPDSIVKNMYLEITNMAQGVNLAALIFVVTTRPWPSDPNLISLSPYLFALTSFLIIIIFWIRYYFDTQVLNRSFTILSSSWFFCYVSIQGIAISFIFNIHLWFAFSGLFLFFAAGFYWLNLREMERKSRTKSFSFKKGFINWQRRRMRELFVLSLLSFSFSIILFLFPSISFYVGCIVFGIAVWQLLVTNDYRTRNFINAGL